MALKQRGHHGDAPLGQDQRVHVLLCRGNQDRQQFRDNVSPLYVMLSLLSAPFSV